MDLAVLISNVKAHEELYNSNHPHSSVPRKREIVWEEIAKKMNRTPAECKRRWTHLRDNLRKALILRNTKIKPPNFRFKPPKYADKLDFLVPFLKEDASNRLNESPFDFNSNIDEELYNSLPGSPKQDVDMSDTTDVEHKSTVRTRLRESSDRRPDVPTTSSESLCTPKTPPKYRHSINITKLIKNVEKHKELYTITHSEYTNQPLRDKIWELIGRKLNQKPGFCKARWNRIRDNHRKALNLRNTKRGRNISGLKPPKYAKELAFIVPYLTQDEKQSSNSSHDKFNDDTNKEHHQSISNSNDNFMNTLNPQESSDGQPNKPTPSSEIPIVSTSGVSCSSIRSLDIRQLIANVKDYEELYDPTNSQYTCQLVRDEIWETIGKRLNEKPTYCKAKWNKIRNNHRKALNLRNTKRGQKFFKLKPPKYAQELAFLVPYLKDDDDVHSNSLISVKSETDETGNGSKLNYLQNTVAEECDSDEETKSDDDQWEELLETMSVPIKAEKESPCQNNTPSTSYVFEDIEDTHSSVSPLQLIKKCDQKNNLKEPFDEIDYLFLSHASTIKKFSPKRQALAKLKVFQVITEQEILDLEENEQRNSFVKTANIKNRNVLNVGDLSPTFRSTC